MEPNGSDRPNEIESWKKFPFAIKNVDEATEQRILKHFKGPVSGLLQVGPEKWMLSKYNDEHMDELYNFKARPDDIFISTFIRSGTTWTQEMMWLLCNDLNYEAARATKLEWRFPFLEIMASFPKDIDNSPFKHVKNLLPPTELLTEMKSPRLIKTHYPIKLMPFGALEKGCKIVYVARNPKDVIVSSYHFVRNIGFLYEGTFEQFLDFFMDDLITWGPYFEHIKDGWSRRKEKNVLFLFYEDLIMDLKGSLKKLAAFLERPLSDDDIPALMNHLNFENFKQNTAVNMEDLRKLNDSKWELIRRGQIGGNPEMTPEIIEKIDIWTEAQLEGSDLKFPHQLHHKMEIYKSKINSQKQQ